MTEPTPVPSAAKPGAPWKTILFVVGLLIVGIGGISYLAAQMKQREKDRITVASDLRKDLDTIFRSAQNGDPIPKLDTHAVVGGEAGELQLFAKTYFNKVISLQNDYLAELKSIGWPEVLDSKRIQNDKGLANSKVIAARAKQTVEKYRQRWAALFAETKASIENMDADSAEKRGFVKGFIDSSTKSNARAMQMWDLEASMVSTTEEIVALLSKSKGSWKVEAGQFVFSDQETLDAFNGRVERINALSAQEEAIRREAAAAADASFRKATEE